ncbi:hypothetical protein ACT21L_004422 [Vibrio vulnificus]
MLLVETATGKVCGVGDFSVESLLVGYHLVDGPYTKNGNVVMNISEISAEIAEIQLNKIHESRQKDYKEESDPLYLEWQYDQTAEKEQAWRDKVAEIKARYPLPSES